MALWWKGQFTLAEHHERREAVPSVKVCQLPDCGHMLHHDQPERVAGLIEQFMA